MSRMKVFVKQNDRRETLVGVTRVYIEGPKLFVDVLTVSGEKSYNYNLSDIIYLTVDRVEDHCKNNKVLRDRYRRVIKFIEETVQDYESEAGNGN